MRIVVLVIFCFLSVCSCSKDRVVNENCNFLLDIGVNITINLGFPEYSQLQFAGNSVFIDNVGNGGIIVAFTGVDYFAWDAVDPNHIQMPCSVLENSGLIATSGCESKNKFNLVNGLPIENGALKCSLMNYRVERRGNELIIFN